MVGKCSFSCPFNKSTLTKILNPDQLTANAHRKLKTILSGMRNEITKFQFYRLQQYKHVYTRTYIPPLNSDFRQTVMTNRVQFSSIGIQILISAQLSKS